MSKLKLSERLDLMVTPLMKEWLLEESQRKGVAYSVVLRDLIIREMKSWKKYFRK